MNPKPIKIAIFMSSLKVGARERLMLEIGKEINNQGNRVHFVFVGASREIKELIEPFPAKTNLLGWTNQAPFLRKINKLKLMGYNKEGIPYQLTADSAIKETKSIDNVLLYKVKADIFLNSKNWLFLNTENAILNSMV